MAPGYHSQRQANLESSILSAISDHGQITGDFGQDYVNLIVQQLRSGALPATLKQKPVAETHRPDSSADTISSGTKAISRLCRRPALHADHYRFAGMVACTRCWQICCLRGLHGRRRCDIHLPGLAGPVLMLGMAVDANILIYEPLTRGAAIAGPICKWPSAPARPRLRHHHRYPLDVNLYGHRFVRGGQRSLRGFESALPSAW
jgi:hypothetical protein